MLWKPLVKGLARAVFNPGGVPRIGLAMMVHNEEATIVLNIRHHARLGVDAFFVLNNGSTDTTRDLLKLLGNEFELHLFDNPEQAYKQALWMTKLNHKAAESGCDLVLSLDADEFYLPSDINQDPSGLLKKLLFRRDSLVTVTRRNMLLDQRALVPGYHFWQAEWMVHRPVHYPVSNQLQQPNLSISLAPLSPKVINSPFGLMRMKGGNHRAKHCWSWLNARQEDGLLIAHYPFRSRKEFFYNVTRRQRLLAAGASMGYHYKRWVKMLEHGCLEDDFGRQVFSQNHLRLLQRMGIASPYPQARQLLEPLIAS